MAAKSIRDGPKRVSLTRQRILDTAVAFADSHGVDALAMRKLADELGFGVMSLYNHVTNKADLLDGMIEVVAGEIELPSEDADWRAALHQSAGSAHRVLMRHAWAGNLWLSRLPGPARLRYMESLLKVLRDAGFSHELVYRGYHAILMHIVGFTMQELNFRFQDEGLDELGRRLLAQVDPDEYPNLMRHVKAHFDGTDHGDEFAFVLDLILEGLDNARGTL